MTFSKFTFKNVAVCLLLVAALIIVALAMGYFQKDSYTITLTDAGFDPVTLSINKGDTVTFVNKRDTYFWPASDLHPTHAIYAAFDSKEPLPPQSSWSFTFDEVGEWTFHDHLAPLYLGVITVTGDEALADAVEYEDCTLHEDYGQRFTCWNDQLKQAYEIGGVEAGLEKFANLFNTETEFSENCHAYTHTLGQLAYADYRSGKDFGLTNQVAYCSYGFFHGFMEALVFETGDYSGSREFCDYVEERLGGDISAVGPCIHGIGHGLTDGYDPRIHGDAQKLVEEPLKICAQLTRTEYEDMICATGVFNSLGELFLRDEGSVLLNPDDMYAVCREQEQDHIKTACYEDLKIVSYALGDSKLDQSLKYILSIDDELRFKKAALENLALYHVYNVIGNEYDYSINTCQSLENDELRISCVRGLASGFINSGTPDKEYVRATDFCTSPLFTEEERMHCYDRMLQAAFYRYAPDVFASVCAIVPEEYHKSAISTRDFCTLEKGIGS